MLYRFIIENIDLFRELRIFFYYLWALDDGFRKHYVLLLLEIRWNLLKYV